MVEKFFKCKIYRIEGTTSYMPGSRLLILILLLIFAIKTTVKKRKTGNMHLVFILGLEPNPNSSH